MGLQEVKSDILADAESKSDQIVEEAEQEADKILEEARKEAKKIEEKYEEQLDQEKESYRKKEISNANMKAREKRLEAKQEKMQEAFDSFEERLEDLSDSEREEYVERCLERVNFDVGKVIGGSDFEEFVDVDFEEKDVHGIIVVSEDGTKRQNFTFTKIVQQFREDYRKKVAEELFPE